MPDPINIYVDYPTDRHKAPRTYEDVDPQQLQVFLATLADALVNPNGINITISAENADARQFVEDAVAAAQSNAASAGPGSNEGDIPVYTYEDRATINFKIGGCHPKFEDTSGTAVATYPSNPPPSS